MSARPIANPTIAERIRTRRTRCRAATLLWRLGWCLTFACLYMLPWFLQPWPRGHENWDFVGQVVFLGITSYMTVGLLLFYMGRAPWRWPHVDSERALSRALSWGDAPRVADAVASELSEPRYRVRPGWSVTDRFLVQSTFFRFDIQRLPDLLWAYRDSVLHAPVTEIEWPFLGQRHQAILVWHDATARIQCSKEQADAIVRHAIQCAPWAFEGSDKQLKRRFSGRAALVMAVAQRRDDWQRAAMPGAG